MKTKNFLILICIFGFWLLAFGFAHAAVLFIEPSSGEYHEGDTFVVNLRIDPEGECINTVEGRLTFSQDVLQVLDFSQGNSLLILWVSPPSINQESGTISFSGGTPGGFCGRIPGDPGESNLLGKVIFSVKLGLSENKNTAVKFLESSQVLLNDGLGTPAQLKSTGGSFVILPGAVEKPIEAWQQELAQDTVPPELFKIEISQDPSIFDGKYFIIFSTTDKQTGIDYYEVKEGGRDWRRATSPYVLEDQGLRSIIKVKAVDKAGNEQIAVFAPPREIPYWTILILIVVAVIGWLLSKWKRKK